MALDSATGSVLGEQGETTMRANRIDLIQFDGDASYLTAGSLAFQQFVRDIVGAEVTVLSVAGYDHNAEPSTALINAYHYDKATDKLQAFISATGVEVANAVDLSTRIVRLTVFSA